jgi:hypothetical protein
MFVRRLLIPHAYSRTFKNLQCSLGRFILETLFSWYTGIFENDLYVNPTHSINKAQQHTQLTAFLSLQNFTTIKYLLNLYLNSFVGCYLYFATLTTYIINNKLQCSAARAERTTISCVRRAYHDIYLKRSRVSINRRL